MYIPYYDLAQNVACLALLMNKDVFDLTVEDSHESMHLEHEVLN